MKILFVCTAAMQRSPTAAELINNEFPKHRAKYAGIHPNAEIPISGESINWADKIFAMENLQKTLLEAKFPKETKDKEIEILNIRDIYHKNDPKLIKLIKEKLNGLI